MTGKKAASKAGHLLESSKSKTVRTVAGSDLAQVPKSGKKKN